MYEHPSIHLQLAKQRHADILAEVERSRVPRDLAKDNDGSVRLAAAKGILAGMSAAVVGLVRPKRVTAQEPVCSTC